MNFIALLKKMENIRTKKKYEILMKYCPQLDMGDAAGLFKAMDEYADYKFSRRLRKIVKAIKKAIGF